MAELISMTYEEARAEHFKALKDEAKRKMNYWATRVRHSRPNDLNDPAHIKASEYGAEYSYYKDALEALAAQPKWISVEDRLPEQFVFVLVYMPDEYPCPTVHEGYLRPDGKWDAAHYLRNPDEVTHWANMPDPPKDDA